MAVIELLAAGVASGLMLGAALALLALAVGRG